MRLVADIGGTNARLGLTFNGVIDPDTVQRFSNTGWDGLDDLLRAYFKAHPTAVVDEMVIAVAGPVHAGRATLTNRNWSILADDLAQEFACRSVTLMNDLAALGYAVPMLGADQVTQLCGPGRPDNPDGQALVVGIGTGFNVSQVITADQRTICPPAEAGHISVPSSIKAELDKYIQNSKHFPTVEALFSGRGLTAFCQAFTSSSTVTGLQATQNYGAPTHEIATQAIDIYAQLLGLLLRDFSLSYMPSHGIYLAGSVARALATVAAPQLVKALQAPSQFWLQKNPSLFVADNDNAALLGCVSF